MVNRNQKPELLAPAGNPEALRTAVLYGADAVYIAGPLYGLRAKARNFDENEMAEGIRYAHERGVRVHVAVNILAHNDQLEGLDRYLVRLREMGADALIVADAGVLDLARDCVPGMELHLSTQASATNYRMMNFWHRHGVKRIVAARELSLRELRQTRAMIDPELELEAFVHGAMCMAISGRCLLSAYLAGQDANQGACVHPCRWKYRLVEETRPGEYMPVLEDDTGTYLLNARDLCMVEYIPELIGAGIGSFKIEGRMKTPLYVAMATRVYREAIDDYFADPALYASKKAYYREELSLISHRGCSTGFYFGPPGRDSQIYENSAYEREVCFAGRVLADAEGGEALVEQRNKFSVGDTLSLLLPRGESVEFTVTSITAEDGEKIENAPHPRQRVRINLPKEAGEGMILMKKEEVSP